MPYFCTILYSWCLLFTFPFYPLPIHLHTYTQHLSSSPAAGHLSLALEPSKKLVIKSLAGKTGKGGNKSLSTTTTKCEAGVSGKSSLLPAPVLLPGPPDRPSLSYVSLTSDNNTERRCESVGSEVPVVSDDDWGDFEAAWGVSLLTIQSFYCPILVLLGFTITRNQLGLSWLSLHTACPCIHHYGLNFTPCHEL